MSSRGRSTTSSGARSTTSSGARSTTSSGGRVDAAAVRRWLALAAQALDAAAGEINALNVFPVPDRDTGTNMALTIRSAAEVAQLTTRPGASGVAVAGADGALTGACGSSGVIVASYLRGFAEGISGLDDADGPALAVALGAAADSAYAAVSEPLEGTILSVARSAASAARTTRAGSVATVARAAAAAARAELAGSTAQLPALAAADVVDAGGQGLVVVLDALADVTAELPLTSSGIVGLRGDDAQRPPGALPFAYEVQYLLDAPAHVLDTLRIRLGEIGDSVAIVRGGSRHNVHVHVNDIGAAIETAIDLGRPSQIRVTRFDDQICSGVE